MKYEYFQIKPIFAAHNDFEKNYHTNIVFVNKSGIYFEQILLRQFAFSILFRVEIF